MRHNNKEICAEIIADSMNSATNDRITTVRITLPKWLLAEFNTHRMLSRNFSSSRAIPAKKIRKMVLDDPFIPLSFGANRKGMQAGEELSGWRSTLAKAAWLYSRYPACFFHWLMEQSGVHKQHANRLLEPWLWAEGVVTATEWNNFFALRCHPDAQPEFQRLACCIREAMRNSKPNILIPGQWHLPFSLGLTAVQRVTDEGAKISAARCARTSYFLQDGQVSNIDADLKLCDRLAGSEPKHLSPFEHPAIALITSEKVGNFKGWKQYRKELET